MGGECAGYVGEGGGLGRLHGKDSDWEESRSFRSHIVHVPNLAFLKRLGKKSSRVVKSMMSISEFRTKLCHSWFCFSTCKTGMLITLIATLSAYSNATYIVSSKCSLSIFYHLNFLRVGTDVILVSFCIYTGST